MLLRMLSACAPCIGSIRLHSGQDQDPSNETIVAPLSIEWGGTLFPMVKHSKCAPLSTEGNTGNSVLGVAVPEQHGAEHIRHLVACPMFAQHIRWVLRARDVPEVEDIGGDCFADSVACLQTPNWDKIRTHLVRQLLLQHQPEDLSTHGCLKCDQQPSMSDHQWSQAGSQFGMAPH